jgi:hypothetical protein
LHYKEDTMSDAFGYRVPGDEDPVDTPETNVTMIDVPMIQTGPPPVDEEGEPVIEPEAEGDDVPAYDNDDPEGDRVPALTDPEHQGIEDIPQEELNAADAAVQTDLPAEEPPTEEPPAG